MQQLLCAVSSRFGCPRVHVLANHASNGAVGTFQSGADLVDFACFGDKNQKAGQLVVIVAAWLLERIDVFFRESFYIRRHCFTCSDKATMNPVS